MNEPTLLRIEAGAMHFSDGTLLRLPRGVTARPFGEGLSVWDLDGKKRHGRVAAGRRRSDCQVMLDYLSKKESR